MEAPVAAPAPVTQVEAPITAPVVEAEAPAEIPAPVTQADPQVEAPVEIPTPETPIVTQNDTDPWSLIDSGEAQKAQSLFTGQTELNAADMRGRTPLIAAAEREDTSLTEFFVSRGADINAADEEGRTALSIAVEKGNAPMTRLLVGGRADIFHKLPNGSSPAETIAATGGELLAAALNPETAAQSDSRGRSLLHMAADSGNPEAVEAILRVARDPNKKDNAGKTALDLTFAHQTSADHAKTAERLVLAGGSSNDPLYAYFAPAARSFNYNTRNRDGVAPLHFAARNGYDGFLTYMLAAGADPNIKNASGSPPLHEAARAGNLKTMNILLAGGADVNSQDGKGNSVLHIGFPPETRITAMQLLLAAGAQCV
ncbi:ankyrin repeat domain-containing protein [Breznakiellaceae bacterium SP9]